MKIIEISAQIIQELYQIMRNLKERGVAFGFHNHAYSLIKNRKGKKEVDARM